ncbi:hypothetical protein E5161_02680 [Cohnella pontilimi]|uniref:Cell wall elongation regulator TseB-like domain-containing protein n=1 Tax=Cohnella pontilimi TaxID=2564100 RepID=A0A4V5LST6_9BACL|nr:DUF5590 domain-containing protein [Cohnella pontilimi]TJY44309.1 hypothetical protein E5161_02680 [Cohnella pontilimi]
MSPRRADKRSGHTTMSMGRWMFVLAGFLLFCAVMLVIFVRSVNAGYRADEQHAIAVAKEQSGLTEVDEAVQYTWEEPVWVVRGRDGNNQTWFVWERKDGILKKQENGNYSEAQIRERFSAEHPTAQSIRVVPGWFDNRPVWEFRYEDLADGNQRPSISFYSFEDGTLLNTYVLPGY